MADWTDRLGVFDLETTGVDIEASHIVSACVALLDGDGAVIGRWDWLADPGVEIPEAASAVHGITTERVQAEGRPASVVIAEITQTLRTLFALGIPVTIYNAPYDLSLLDRECRRHGLDPIGDPGPVIDPLVLDKAVDRYRKGKRTLEAAAERYNVALDEAHDAGADAIAAGRVAQALARAYPAELGVEAPRLHRRQTVWYAEQAARFQDYIRRAKGEQDYVASTAWPVRMPENESYRDTQPIPPLPPRPSGHVPVLDFSKPIALQLAPPPSSPMRPAIATPPTGFGPAGYRQTTGPIPPLVLPLVEPQDLIEPEEPARPAELIEAEGPDVETSDADESPVDFLDDDLDDDDLDDDELAIGQPTPRAVLRVAAAIVVDEAGRNLLVRKRGSTQFMQAGGKLEEGEVAIEALARELAEELGFELDPGETEYLGFFRADAAHESDTELHAEVFALTVAGDIEAQGEIEELLWVDRLDAVPTELAPLTRDELLPLWASRRAAQLS
jgi:DNA polymerase-3 subunit epsilon